jgi:protein-tyrosine phosphatase
MGKSFIKRQVKNIYWNLYGRTIRNPGLPSPARSILFVCKGNICRSPFAEKIAIKHSNLPDRFSFGSAGIRVEDPKPATMEAILTAKRFGVDLQDHNSRRINYDLVESFDLITAMEAWQYQYLRKIFLEFREKISLLPLFEKDDGILPGRYSTYNIKDPYGRNMDEYQLCFSRIENCIAGLIHRINLGK